MGRGFSFIHQLVTLHPSIEMMRALALCGLLAASSAVPIYNLTDGAQGPYGARPTPVPTFVARATAPPGLLRGLQGSLGRPVHKQGTGHSLPNVF